MSEQTPPVSLNEALYNDDAISDWAEDVLQREALVERLRKAISGWPQGRALVLGLIAPWGTGKSSVVNLLKKELEDKDDALVILFDPWFFNSSENLIQGFLTELEIKLKREPGFSLKKEGKQTLAKARRFVSSLPSISILGFGVDTSNLAEGTPSLEDLKNAVEALCKGLKRRVIIVFDDIDRLSSGDVLIALKLIKVWTSLTPFTYVLSYDRQATEKKLKDELRADPKLLEKLIQVEVALPSASMRRIGQYVDESIESFKQYYDLDYEHDFENRLGEMWRESLSIGLRTIREVKRFLNAVAFTLPMVKGEVNYADLFGVEYVRVAFPTLYEHIRTHKTDFAGPSESSSYSREEIDERRESHKKLLESLPDDDSRRSASSILGLLFPKFLISIKNANASGGDVETWTKENRVAAADRFDTYFWLTVSEGEVSDVWVQGVIQAINGSKSAEEVAAVFKEAVVSAKAEGLTNKFLGRIVLFADKVVPERVVDLIWAILGHEQDYDVRGGFLERSEHDVAGVLIFGLVSRWATTDKIQEVLLEIVKKGPWSFAATIVHFADRSRNMIVPNFDHIDQGALRQALRQRFVNQVVDKELNFLAMEPMWATSLLRDLADRAFVTDYLAGVFRREPATIGPFLAKYVWTPFDRAYHLRGLGEVIDVGVFRSKLQDVSFPAFTKPEESFAFDIVMKPNSEGEASGLDGLV